MADQNQPTQTPQVGVVGQQGQPQAQPGQPQPAPQPQRGVPGTPQPPVPTPEQIQQAVAKQQAQQQADMAEAQRRANELAKQAQDGQPVQALILGQPQPGQPQQGQPQQGIPAAQQTIPQSVAAQMPPGMQPPPPPQQPQQPQVQQPQQPAPSPIPGMTAQQVLAGIPQQGQPQGQPAGNNQFAQYAQPQPVEKVEVPWYPIRSKGVDVELEDSIIKAIPNEGIAGEGNAQAKVVLALFSEVLYLRQLVTQIMEQGPGVDQQLAQRVYQLERVLFEQRQGMQQRARSIKDQIAMFTAQGMTPDQMVAALSSQADAAVQMVETGAIEQPPEQPAQAQPQEGQAPAQTDAQPPQDG